MTTSVLIQRATPEDASALAKLAADTFRDAFEAENDPRDMSDYIREAFSTEQVARELRDKDSAFLLAARSGSGEPIGYAKLRAGRPEPCVGGANPVELERIYVSSQVIGHGVGKQLMAACLEEARADHYKTLWLGVWEHNHRAVEFYKRWGFREVGTHTFQLGSDAQVDLVLELSLEESS